MCAPSLHSWIELFYFIRRLVPTGEGSVFLSLSFINNIFVILLFLFTDNLQARLYTLFFLNNFFSCIIVNIYIVVSKRVCLLKSSPSICNRTI